MLTFFLLFLVTFFTSAIVVWMYRRIPEIQDFISELFTQSDSATKPNGGLQQFMSSVSTPGSNAGHSKRVRVRNTKLRRPKGDIKAPWGW